MKNAGEKEKLSAINATAQVLKTVRKQTPVIIARAKAKSNAPCVWGLE